MFLKQATSALIALGPFSLSSDGVAVSSSQTDMTVTLSKNGGTYADSTTGNITASTNNNGMYLVELTAVDTSSLSRLDIMVHNTTHLPVFDRYTVLPANTYDSLISDSTELHVDNSTQPVEGALTMLGVQRLMLSILTGETTGGGSTAVTFKATTGGVTRLTGDVNSNGNRFNITLVTTS